MKYTIKNILKNTDSKKFLFFWGASPSTDGTLNKSCLSQWYPCSFTVDGIEYKSAEHYMMAEKARLFNDLEIRQKIVDSASPAEAKKLGRMVKNFKHEVWEANRSEIVKMGNYYKFLQNEEIGDYLRKTKDRILVEASPVDAIWGIGMAEDHEDVEYPERWRGKNLLGFAMMEARDELMKLK